MTFLFVIGILFLAGAAALVTRALTLSRIRMSAQMREIESYGYTEPKFIADAAPGVSGLRATLNALAARVGQRAQGTGWRAPVSQVKLRAAALYTIDPDVFHGYRVMATFTIPPFLLLVTLKSGSFGATRLLMILLTAGLCWFGPSLLVERRAPRRMDRGDRYLSEPLVL